MMEDNDKISSAQQGMFQFLTMLGMGIIILPSFLVKGMQNDSWMFCAAFGLFNILIVFFISRLVRKYRGDGLMEMMHKIFGKGLGNILAIPAFLFFIFVVSSELRLFGETIKAYLLARTPLEFIILPLILATVALVRSGIEPITRFFEFVFPILAVLGILFALQCLPQSDYTNLRPFFRSHISDIQSLYSFTLYTYSGYELLLIISPFLKNPNKTFKVSYIVIAMITAVYTFLVIECLARFGVKETQSMLYPVISLIKSSDVPGGFLERTEGILMAVWVIFAFAKIVSYTYAYSVVSGDALKFKEKKHMVAFFIPILYILALQGDSIMDVFNIINKMTLYLGTYTIIILPLLMYIVSIVEGRKGDEK